MSKHLLANILHRDQAARMQASLATCQQCCEKDLEIRQLKVRVEELEKALAKSQRRREKPYGSNTPSSKCNTDGSSPKPPETKPKNRGGGKPGRKGTSRPEPSRDSADEVIPVAMPSQCPDCGFKLASTGSRLRRVLDISKAKVKEICYELSLGGCPCCGKTWSKPVSVLPRFLLGNELLAQISVSHFVHGISLGRLTKQFGLEVGLSTILSNIENLGKLAAKAHDDLVSEFRSAYVRHADETGWRQFGERGYGWLFSSTDVAIFCLEKSRGSQIPRRILGNKPLDGCLVVDRYSAYNKLPVRLQYCYAHLLRDLEELANDFPYDEEVLTFVEDVRPMLSSAMSLRGLKIADEEFKTRAKELSGGIHKAMLSEASHLGVQAFQNIFRDHADRMYLWSTDRRIPADNNQAEREIRNLVVARKISYESKSTKAADTRSHIMSLLFTAQKRLGPRGDPVLWLKEALDRVAADPGVSLYDLLPSPVTKLRQD